MRMPSSAEFRLFGPEHVGALVVVALACALVGSCRAWMGPSGRGRLGQVLAGALLLYTLHSYWLVWRAGNLTADYALPLHLCNLLVFLGIWVLLRPSLGGSELLYYWGVGGSAQALITPDLQAGFPTGEFFRFFCGHGLLVVAVVHLVAVLGFRPRPEGMWRAFAWLLVWVGVVGGLDAVFGWNYGYLCQKPQGASILDHLGPWPWYVLGGIALALGIFWLLSLPWRSLRTRSTSR